VEVKGIRFDHLPIGVRKVIIPVECAVQVTAFPMESKSSLLFACNPNIYKAVVRKIQTQFFTQQLTVYDASSELQFCNSL